MSSTRSPKPPTAPAKEPAFGGRRGLIIGGIVAALVAVALIVAFAVSGGDDGETQSPVPTDDAAGAEPTDTVSGNPVAPAEQQPVAVEGTDLVSLPDGGEDPAVGLAAPTVDGYTFDGTPMEITPGGTAKMVVFLAHWCPHCNREIPRILEWAEAGRVPEGLEIVGVATGTDESAPNYPPSTWLADLGWTYPTLADSPEFRAAQAYGVSGFPFFTIVDDTGKVLGRFSGELEVDDLDATVRSALGLPTD